jgi:sugar-specific transcriptional regulator TrmB
MEASTEAQMLLKIQDIGEFLRKSFNSLEHMAKVSVNMKKEIYILTSLQPYIVDTGKTLDLINKFDLVPPSKDIYNNFELKFLKEAPTYAQQSEPKLGATLGSSKLDEKGL